MMGENFISYFDRVSGAANEYYVETEDIVNIQRLKAATLLDNIFPSNPGSLFIEGFNKYDHILSFMKLKKAVSDFTESIDLVVVLGGDDFTEDYGWKSPLLYAVQFNLLKREGLKIVMLGQTMGPFHSFRIPLMKRLLNRIDRIYPRDQLTYQYLKDFGLANISITDDLALLPLKKQEMRECKRELITFCPSELIYRYAKEGNRETWIDFSRFMLETILKRYPDKKVILLAHVLKPEHVDDRRIVNELYQLLREKYKNRIIAIDFEIYPNEVRKFIQRSQFIVSARMHAVLSSFQCGIPAVALSYSSKYWGIIGDRYGLPEYIIDVRHLNYKQMRAKFIALLDKMEAEQLLIEEKIKRNNALAEKNIMDTLKEILA